MHAMLWPLALVVLSNILYNISSKAVPAGASPYLTVIITYITAAFCSFVLYCIFDAAKFSAAEITKAFLPGFAPGVSMAGLEIGYILMYRAGWKISIASLLCNILLALALLAIGVLFYREKINFQQVAGFALRLAGSLVLRTAKN